MTQPFVSVYEPAEIEIEGTRYKLRRRSRSVMRQLSQIEAKLMATTANEERVELGYEQAGLLIDAPQDVIDALDMRQINEITRWVVAAATGKVEPDEGDEKNALKPGGEAPPA
jgi:hypothetical protein